MLHNLPGTLALTELTVFCGRQLSHSAPNLKRANRHVLHFTPRCSVLPTKNRIRDRTPLHLAATVATIPLDWKSEQACDNVAALALSMGRRFCVLFVCLIALPLVCQTPSSNPQVATITAVNVRQKDAENTGRAAAQYDVSLQIDNTVYVA